MTQVFRISDPEPQKIIFTYNQTHEQSSGSVVFSKLNESIGYGIFLKRNNDNGNDDENEKELEEIKEEEIILEEEALAFVPKRKDKRMCCSYCLSTFSQDKSLSNIIQTFSEPLEIISCRCRTEDYCSKICWEKARDSYHRFLCPLLSGKTALNLFNYLEENEFFFSSLAVKIFAQEILKFEKFSSNFEGKTPFSDFNCFFFSDLLPNHQQEQIILKILDFLKQLLANNFSEELFQIFEPYLSLKFYMQICWSIRLNNFGLKHKKKGEATLIFYTTSLFNHSCDPNCDWKFSENSKIQIFSKKNIKIGEELTISYFKGGEDCSLNERRDYLEKSYFFKCYCSRCKREKHDEDAIKDNKNK